MTTSGSIAHHCQVMQTFLMDLGSLLYGGRFRGHLAGAPCWMQSCTLSSSFGAGHAGVRKALDGGRGPSPGDRPPPSLLENWQRELAKWCPGLRMVTYYGKDRWQLREELKDWR